MARDYLSIGEVLVNLRPEFPDVTISKIRFLESEGLIQPERTASGYRKFYERDVDRLRNILKLQRDEYLPLRVIRQRLEEGADGQVPAAAAPKPEQDDDLPTPATDLQMPADELAAAAGVDRSVVDDLTSFGLLRPERLNGEPFYGGDDLVVVRVAKDFLKYGVQARHLTMYRHFADREASLFQQIVLPMLRQRNPDAQRAASEAVGELSRTSKRLKQALLRANLRQYTG